jgi:putative membrane protein
MRQPDPWAFHLHPEVWALMVGIIVGYWYLVRRGPVSRKQVALFTSGWALLWFGADYPIHDIGEKYLFSVHMVQHMLFSLIAPGLLILGIPEWLRKELWGTGRRAAVVRVLGRPAIGGVLYTVWLVFSHWPTAMDLALRHEPVHFLFHLALFSTASLMWFPVLNRDPALPMLGEVGRMLYVFLQSIMPTVPAAFFTFAEGVIYPFYAHAPRPFSIDAVSDQQLAGAIMKVGGGLILWLVIGVMFFRWTARDEKERLARRRTLARMEAEFTKH